MNNQSPSMGDLARLLFKAQSEVNTLVDRLSPGLRAHLQPLLDLAVGDQRMGLKAASPKSFEANFRQRNLEYRLVVDDIEPGKKPSAQAKLINHDTGAITTLTADAILRDEVPAEFADLHKTVTAQVRSVLPASLWNCLRSLAPTKSESAKAPDEPTSTEASSPAAESELKQFIIHQEDGPDLRFTGKFLDGVRTHTHQCRWTELMVYQTRGGKFVGLKVGRSLHLGEVDRTATQVAESLEGLSEFFGHGRAAKVLFERLGVQRFNDIE